MVAANANQNPPVKVYQRKNTTGDPKRLEDLPMVPNTTQGKVFPRMNSRMLVMSNKSPPRKMIGPLCRTSDKA